MSTPTIRALRTALQTLLAVVAVVGLVTAAVADNATIAAALPWLAAAAPGAAAVAGAIARIMATPQIEQLLDRLGLGLPDGSEE
ncbi:hypothetical protein ACWEQU_12885 [Streptomyces nodosus]